MPSGRSEKEGRVQSKSIMVVSFAGGPTPDDRPEEEMKPSRAGRDDPPIHGRGMNAAIINSGVGVSTGLASIMS